MKPFLLRLDDATHKRLKVLAAKEEKTLTQLIKDAIKILWEKKAA